MISIKIVEKRPVNWATLSSAPDNDSDNLKMTEFLGITGINELKLKKTLKTSSLFFFLVLKYIHLAHRRND
jgi:hypothetical protein